ncbi:MAG TPA: CBS domain-containing protein [Nitrospirota bacterium]|nr:CBS domain-containing protein [Nitrospirota bacterium]
MEAKNLGALLVVENGTLAGVFSKRDCVRKVILKERSSKNTLVREIVSESPIFVSPSKSLRDCMVLMADKHMRPFAVKKQWRDSGYCKQA